ncbi:alcohol dehydrogenase catalytic domain-containing protein [Streptosporangium sp. NBC_01755]|uniref:zinc-dependent alcohol dehydrogenase n=1 Tax=Streptosporangium sp. NBC_01755 TaxID=2975949 RepID=UPI002DDB4DAA|nr:alcohol dehydrogenase catalytic domain-containing protein [Streptosporangium sp. NBC_01755]WSD01345.1 alcohol dehydrogenase catalytic domain-containing protein [Streptosporangium sp. NBC_01755]
MRALVFTKPSTVELLDVQDPPPVDGEVLVKVRAVGICGSELHGIRDSGFRRPPLIMGHEFAGTTPDGRRVTVNPLLSCGACDLCLMGRDHLCRERAILGIHRPGAFAEYVSVPEKALHPLAPSMSFETAAVIEPLANGVHALNLARPAEGARVAVLGAGTIGLVSMLVARRFSDQVVVCDLSRERLEVAGRLGATAVTTSLQGEFDIVVDAVGAAATHRMSVQHLRPGGTAVWVGLLSSDAAFDGQKIVREEKHVVGSYCYTAAEFAQAVKLAEEVALDWTSCFDLADGAAIFGELMTGRQDVVKALLRPWGEE